MTAVGERQMHSVSSCSRLKSVFALPMQWNKNLINFTLTLSQFKNWTNRIYLFLYLHLFMVLIHENVSKSLRHKVSSSLRQHTRKPKDCFRTSQASKQINLCLLRKPVCVKMNSFSIKSQTLILQGRKILTIILGCVKGYRIVPKKEHHNTDSFSDIVQSFTWLCCVACTPIFIHCYLCICQVIFSMILLLFIF